MKIPVWIVDAFCAGPFTGNPAAVCPLEDGWLDDATLLAIAAQHNLSESAFLVRETTGAAADWKLRWFTPETEVELCGHATLASAHAIREAIDPGAHELRFATRSGPLTVSAADDGSLVLDFPARPGRPVPAPAGARELLGTAPVEWLVGPEPVRACAVVDSEDQLRALDPDPREILTLARSLMVTAPSADAAADYALRFFAPGYGIDEDPATGSAQCTLVPYWAGRLGKNRLVGMQLSTRGAEFRCEHAGARTRIGGRARTYLRGEIEI